MSTLVRAPSAIDAVTTSARPALRAEALIRRHRGGRGLGPVDLTVGRGTVLAIIGRNGAGKTTLLRLLASVDRPASGTVTWLGETDRRRARRHIGWMPDDPAEEPTLSPRQASYFWCRQWVDDARGARALVDEALARMGLAERADEPAGDLSYGLRRRLAIAQALAHRPALAFLDEPSAGLDADGTAALVRTLRERAAAGLTSVVAGNDTALVAACADEAVLIHEGMAAARLVIAELARDAPPRRRVTLRTARPAAGVVGAVPGITVVDATEETVTVDLVDERALPGAVAAADAAGLRGVEIEDAGVAGALESAIAQVAEEQR